MKTFTIGDIHGSYLALIQVLKKCGFDYEVDELVALGDVVDGWYQTKECIDELLKIKNLVYLMGNHDFWALDWMRDECADYMWTSQGGMATQSSYNFNFKEVPDRHIRFLEDAKLYMHDRKTNQLFVHGGFDPDRPIKEQAQDKQNFQSLFWDRELLQKAYMTHTTKNGPKKYGGYEDIFLGHTTTQQYNATEPTHFCNVWNLDTGAGWSGQLTIMDVKTKEYFQSDYVYELYPNVKGRG